MDVISVLQDVRSFETSSGNVRYVARDVDGNEYTTLREDIGERAKQLQGQGYNVQPDVLLFGHSRGAQLALRFTEIHPEQVSSVAAKIGSAEFFEPLILIEPLSGCPP